MLADEIVAAGREPSPELRLMGVDVASFARAVADAVRFDVSVGAILTAHTVRDTPVDARIKALRLARFPFGRTWFEWPGDVHGVTSSTAPRSDARVSNAPTPRRMGVLVTTDDSLQRGTLDYAWVHHQLGINICPLRLTFDWREENEPVPDIAQTRNDEDLLAIFRREAGHRSSIERSSDEALLLDHRRFGLVISPIWEKTIDTLIARGMQDAAGSLCDSALRDIKGEADILRALVMVMNSRNLVEMRHRAAPEKLNRHRVKAGKPPLLDTTEVVIRMSHALASRAGGDAGDRRSPRAHVVRGHFKVRSSGVFWWQPFMRGQGAAPAPKSYRVVP